MRAIHALLDKGAKRADRLMAQKGTLRRRTFGALDVVTGQQLYSDEVTHVKVRSWPLSVRERVDLAEAGLNQVDTRWTLRCAYAANIQSDDILTVGPFHYEVLTSSPTKDEFGVEWTLLTRRRP